MYYVIKFTQFQFLYSLREGVKNPTFYGHVRKRGGGGVVNPSL